VDSEFLHDYRVAVRRTRSALTQVKKVFPDDRTEHFKERFAWLGQITGPTRDMHVYLLGFDDYRDSLPQDFQKDLEPLRAFLRAHQKLEHGRLVKKLASAEYKKLMEEWRDFLKETDLDPASKHGGKPLAEVANKRIYKMAQRVFDEGDAIDAQSPPEDLHELRKSCKKLRYLMEFFQSIYPPAKIGGLIREIKRLLDNLGDYQDLEVQASKLREFAHQMVKEGDTPADTLLAMGMLVDGLLRRQQEKRGEFKERYARFADKENRQRFRVLFESGEGK
jgi:CHAD domain-containing protein